MFYCSHTVCSGAFQLGLTSVSSRPACVACGHGMCWQTMVECLCFPGLEPHHKPWLAGSGVSLRGHEEFGTLWTLWCSPKHASINAYTPGGSGCPLNLCQTTWIQCIPSAVPNHERHQLLAPVGRGWSMGHPQLLSCVNDNRQILVSVKPQGGIGMERALIYTLDDLFVTLSWPTSESSTWTALHWGEENFIVKHYNLVLTCLKWHKYNFTCPQLCKWIIVNSSQKRSWKGNVFCFNDNDQLRWVKARVCIWGHKKKLSLLH